MASGSATAMRGSRTGCPDLILTCLTRPCYEMCRHDVSTDHGCDDDATMELRVSTVRYVKDIERDQINLDLE